MSLVENFLFELGCEELPPKSLNRLAISLLDGVCSGLEKKGLGFDKDASRWFATPRRLAFRLVDLQQKQADRVVSRKGPSVDSAFSEDGSAKPAALGFARSCGVAVSELSTTENDKGRWLCFEQEEAGATVESLLPDIIAAALNALPVAKRMRWGKGEHSFVRPVHWLLALMGARICPMSILGLESSSRSRGHRFHAPDEFTLASADDYEQPLFDAHVVVDSARRCKMVREGVTALADKLGAKAVISPPLLDEVTSLVEWPVAVPGSFDSQFLQVPSECLISSMESHQKFFPLIDEAGDLLPSFIGVANIESRAPEQISSGLEKVIRPRLADAQFFWNRDLKRPLAAMRADLKGMIFQYKLGSIFDKTERVSSLANQLAETLGEDPQLATIAGRLCKADLVSDMVNEFADLQGVMGRYYARSEGLEEAVADALQEHYYPRFSGDQLPKTTLSSIIAVADRADSLCGIFAVGLRPTGNKDPFALRRAALGLIRLCIENRLEIDLPALLDSSSKLLPADLDFTDQVRADLLAFLSDRLRGYYQERGFTAQTFDAVSAAGLGNLLDFDQRILAVSAFGRLDAAESLAAANKRIANLLRKSELNDAAVDTTLLSEKAETNLHDAILALNAQYAALMAKRDYANALELLAGLRPAIDTFFDQVLVMAEDSALKSNRLALLQLVYSRFADIADIGKL